MPHFVWQDVHVKLMVKVTETEKESVNMPSYKVDKCSSKRGWRVLEITGYNRKGQPEKKHVSYKEYERLGFNESVSIEFARQRAKQLNAQSDVAGHAREAVKARIEKDELALKAFLPVSDVQKFEAEVLYLRVSNERAKMNKLSSRWRAALKVIVLMKLDVSDWYKNSTKFYDYFSSEKWSMSWVEKVLPIINKWGEFYADQYQIYFKPIPLPVKNEREKIRDAYFDANEETLESDPLTPEMLEGKRSELRVAQYNWLQISIWFGLRPSEVDQLHKPSQKRTWWIETQASGKVLYVYQNKLKSVAHEKRVKYIPVHFKQQDECLKIIQAGNFERPLAKTITPKFKGHVTTYGGRKGFMALMQRMLSVQDKETFFEISKWLGHHNINRTWKSYTDKLDVKFFELKKSA